MNRIKLSSSLLTGFIVLLLQVSFLGGGVLNARAAPDGQPDPNPLPVDNPYLRIVETTPTKLVLELTPAAPQFEATQSVGQTCQSVRLPGLSQIETPGMAPLPVQGVMLGIPQDALPSLKLLAAEATSLPGSYDLCPSPSPVLDRSPDGRWQLNGAAYERGPAYQTDAFTPGVPAELVSTGSLRSQRYAEIRFNPLHYNPITGELRYFSRIRIELDFNSKEGRSASPGSVNAEGYFEDSLQALLLNYAQARAWRSQPTAAAQPAAAAPASTAAYKILVNQDGLYKVSYADLQTAGVPVDSLDPRTFQLFNQSTQAAIYVQGEADGAFNPGDYLLFYGQKVNSMYTSTNVYWLSWGASTGLRMAELNGAPSGSASVPAYFATTQHAEIDTDYYSDQPSGAALDHWYWGMVYASSASAYLDFKTELHHLDTGSHTVVVRGLLNGYSATPNHHTRIYLNGNLIDDHSFPTGSEYSFTASVPQSYLVEGVNTLRVQCPRDGSITLDAVLVNWFEIDYSDTYFAEGDRLFFGGDQAGTWEYRVDGFTSGDIETYDISDPLAPVRISGATVQATGNGQQVSFEAGISAEQHYLAQTTGQRLSPLSISQDSPSSWKSTAIGADYIIITPADFLSQAQTLANFRAGQGLRVQVVDIQDVYDEFNGGVFSAEAIKSFLTYAYANWVAPAPSFVLLLGDGNFDFKNVYKYNSTNYIPPYLAEVDPWIGQTATDNRYVSVSGGDILPDMYIGRFPVRSVGEAQTMVDKAINYEQNPPQDGWNAYQTFVADNPDSGGNFPVQSDQIINTYVPATYTVDKIYLSVNYTSASAAKSALKTAINQGRLIVHYDGHASTQQWATENLFALADISTLANGSKLPFFLPMTCAEGYFIWPSPSGQDYSAVGEGIVRANARGAIASWSPAGYGLSSGHTLLDRSVFNDLFNNHRTQLGYLTTNAKYYLYANSAGYNDLIETYLLFGDPALRLQALPVAAPAAPSNIQASAVSSAAINLTWQDNSSDETEFQIERSPDGVNNWQQIAVVAANTTQYTDSGRSCETHYYYRLRAYRATDAQASSYSGLADAVTYACRTISFVPGWNLITLPLNPVTPYKAESLLVAINGQGGACSDIDRWIYGGWEGHHAGGVINNFDIVLGEGYFVKCTQVSDWILDGSRLSSGVMLNLIPGWNLVGIPYPESGYKAQTVMNGVTAQGGSCSEMVHWVYGGWETYSTALPFLNNYDVLPYEGYFVKCAVAHSYTP